MGQRSILCIILSKDSSTPAAKKPSVEKSVSLQLLNQFEDMVRMKVDEVDRNGWTLLHHACQRSAEEPMPRYVGPVVEHMPPSMLDEVISGGESALGWPAVAMLCLAANSKNCTNDRVRSLQLVLKARADPNVRIGTSESTALITASGNGNVKAVEMLYANGVGLNQYLTNIRGKNAANVVPQNHYDLKELFRKKGLQPVPEEELTGTSSR